MRIALLGDIGLFDLFQLTEENEIRNAFSEVKAILSDCDYVVGNLETPLKICNKNAGGITAKEVRKRK